MSTNGEPNQQFNQDQQNASTGGGPAQTPGVADSRTANYSTGQQAGQTGSGRFTNLQKYIGANAGAGDRLAQGITSKVNQQNQPAQKEADTSASAVREGIQSANQKLDTGNNYLSQVQGSNFNANDIAQDQNKLQDFSNYRTGNAVDTNGLAAQNNTAQTNNLNYQNQLNQQLGQTQTDQGRYNLLKGAFGGGTAYQNPYSTGQQRLDQLFLQSGGTNGINNLQNNLRTNQNQAGQQLGQLQNQSGQISTIGTNANNLATGLQSATTGITNKYVGDIAATQDAVNKQRVADQTWAQNQYKNLQDNGQVDQRFASLLGLNGGQNLYNSLTGKNSQDVLNYGAANLTGADQLANANQRSYYDSLAKLSGVNPGQYAINAGGDPEAAVSNKNTINDLLTSGKNTYTTNTAGKNFTSDWGGGNIIDLHGNIGTTGAENSLNGLSTQGRQQFSQLNAANANNMNDPLAGFSPEDAQVLRNATGQVGITSSWGNNPAAQSNAYNPATLLALQQAAGMLGNEGYFNRVNIAPPSDLEKKQNIT